MTEPQQLADAITDRRDELAVLAEDGPEPLATYAKRLIAVADGDGDGDGDGSPEVALPG